VSNARAIVTINKTTPPPELTMTADDPYVMIELPRAQTTAKTDLSKVEAYTQGSVALRSAIRTVGTFHIDRCVFTHIDADHILPINFNRTYSRNRMLDWADTRNMLVHAGAIKNLVLLRKEANFSNYASTWSLITNTTHSDLGYSNVISCYVDLLEKAAEPLAGYEQYNVANWDGNQAQPVTSETLAYARKLLKVMPDTLGKPDVAPAGDGTIALEWVPDYHHSLAKLFLDVGPGETWCAYWRLRNGHFHTVTHEGFDAPKTKAILHDLFEHLSN
jgi:hypothetical protein